MLSALSKFELQPSYLEELCRTYPVDLVVFDAPYACDSAKYCGEYCMKGEGELYDICGAILSLLNAWLLSLHCRIVWQRSLTMQTSYIKS